MPVKIFAFVFFAIFFVACSSSSVKEEPNYEPKVIKSSDTIKSSDISEMPKDLTINAAEVKIVSPTTTIENQSIIKEPDPIPTNIPAPMPNVPLVVVPPMPIPQTPSAPLENPSLPKPEEIKPIVPPKPVLKDYHTIRIIALDHRDYFHDQCIKIQKKLEKEGISDVLVYEYTNKNGKKLWVIDVGKFDSPKSAKAEEVFTKIKDMKFEGRKQFTGAYFVFKKN